MGYEALEVSDWIRLDFSQTGLLNYILLSGVYARGSKRSHVPVSTGNVYPGTLPWTGSTQETVPDEGRGSERLTLSLSLSLRSQLYHSNLGQRWSI